MRATVRRTKCGCDCFVTVSYDAVTVLCQKGNIRTGVKRSSDIVADHWIQVDIGVVRLMSALPPKADIDRARRDVRFVPIADIVLRLAS